MGVGWFMLDFLGSLIWGYRTVTFVLSGFYCRVVLGFPAFIWKSVSKSQGS